MFILNCTESAIVDKSPWNTLASRDDTRGQVHNKVKVLSLKAQQPQKIKVAGGSSSSSHTGFFKYLKWL